MSQSKGKAKRRSDILEAAIKSFAQFGSANAKISDIAKLAGIGKGTIYEYFRSKDELFNESFHFFMEKIEALLSRKCFRVYEPIKKLRTYITSWADILTGENIEYIEVMLDYWAEGIRRKDDKTIFDLVEIYEENRKMLQSILDECLNQRKIRAVNTKIIASIIIGSLDGLLLQWITSPGIFDLKKAFFTLSDTIIRGIEL